MTDKTKNEKQVSRDHNAMQLELTPQNSYWEASDISRLRKKLTGLKTLSEDMREQALDKATTCIDTPSDKDFFDMVMRLSKIEDTSQRELTMGAIERLQAVSTQAQKASDDYVRQVERLDELIRLVDSLDGDICKNEDAADASPDTLDVLIRKTGKTRAELAEVVGVHPSVFSKWIKGQSLPHSKNVRKLAKAIWGDEHRYIEMIRVCLISMERYEEEKSKLQC